MLTPAQRKTLNTDFYTALGAMMQGDYSATGRRIKWTNYRTGVKDAYVRMEADNKGARFGLEFQHADAEIRYLFWEQLEELKALMESEMGDALVWHRDFYKPDGTHVCRVEQRLDDGNLYDKSTWPVLLVFLKENLLAFDRFWANAAEVFTALED
jgi:hypothetical protein